MGNALQEANYFDGKEEQDVYILIGSQGVGGSKVKSSSRMEQPPGRANSYGGGGSSGSQDWKPTNYSLSKYILHCVMCVLCSVCLGQSLDSV